MHPPRGACCKRSGVNCVSPRRCELVHLVLLAARPHRALEALLLSSLLGARVSRPTLVLGWFVRGGRNLPRVCTRLLKTPGANGEMTKPKPENSGGKHGQAPGDFPF
jgi:hypothetical protein